ncbi:hypothetical protein BJ684DRAFT_21884 [Piptocephalis cylindrospora]|uniref:Uncharacterized protein n=1 Tax=Piptocephalis cylindrospora TaxID=1907219 RepID=A0A4P9XYL5_9FUNG|nr:hypothetical protein BJ684DRAFT_21884 [Piptocephalis cylindrospora]|eukprot:RKP11538.1 hypothetical protein BJ684DRAFT_21884 [Piptocephalis cylindrospora]
MRSSISVLSTSATILFLGAVSGQMMNGNWQQQQMLQTGNWLNNPGVGGGAIGFGGQPGAFDYDSCAAGCTDPNYQQSCIRECGLRRMNGGMLPGSMVGPGGMPGSMPLPVNGGMGMGMPGVINPTVGGLNPSLGNVEGSQNWGNIFTQNGRNMIICPATAVFPNGTRCTPGTLTVASANNVPGRRNGSDRTVAGFGFASLGLLAAVIVF